MSYTEKRDAKGQTEKEYLDAYRERAGKYPRPFLTADCVILAPEPQMDTYRVLLIRRRNHPFLGALALPGGFAEENEPLLQTAMRELREETGVAAIPTLLGVYSDPGRDPRGWVVSCAFCAVLDAPALAVAMDDAAKVGYYTAKLEDQRLTLSVDGAQIVAFGPDFRHEALAFDHGRILYDALCAQKNASRHAWEGK